MQGGPHDNDNRTYHADAQAQQELLSAYLDGALDGSRRDALERHLATCEDCQRDLAGLRRVRALLRALPAPALPRSFILPETGHEAAPEPVHEPAHKPARDLPPARRGVTPIRLGSARTQWRRTAQWAGGIAAVIGLLLLLGSVLPGVAPSVSLNSHSAAGATTGSSYGPVRSSSTSSPTQEQDQARTPTGGAVAVRQTPPTTPGTTATSAGAAKTTPSPTPHVVTQTTPGADSSTGAQNGNSGSSFPYVPVGGGVLLVGGVALFSAGRLGGRKRRRRQRG